MSSEPIAKTLSIKQILIRIIIIICSIEFVIMLAFHFIPKDFTTYSAGVLDTTLLALLSTPLIYLWVIRPFVNARDEMLSQINHLAYIDPLTQLANRRLLSELLEKAVASIARHNIYGALLLLDLDKFKPINDEYGHDAGDDVLVEIAKRMQSITRSEDVVARLGGDEFLIYISHLDSDELKARDKAVRIANNLIRLVSKPIQYQGKDLQVGASIGIRLLDREVLSTETAIHEADIAMYLAKDAGRGRAIIFEGTGKNHHKLTE